MKNKKIKEMEDLIEIKTKKEQTMTINYFGNIQDSLIGQIKTKIPMPLKKDLLRSLGSPLRQKYNH